MTISNEKKTRRKIRKRRSTLIKGSVASPRVVLSESNRYLRVQAIDDAAGHTLLASSTQDFVEKDNNFSRKNKDYAKKLGEVFAEKLKKSGQKKIVFDRNGRPYHGKIEAFCQTLRESGINF
ncbi:50S ribosomal protein L18 [endosymbiont DhMRE of Dentiscutata heterogama]|uniref:50S ribosomal protein L18 n=1 Tax=endosymbiont DhMRE of Dentiscutata heterogama TaxID=1609546 RepID=UPI000629D613|nr:50S ribosomal protein L18 [endosymbiont DhMRE of Dentiscutata heterogama]CFW92810.1 50S ribosomal protein L18 [endosymbiont DhMRE of Dentiscutata heterogama]